MYAGGPDQDENFVVPGWNAQPLQQTHYRDVVARSCRMCHEAVNFNALKFRNANDFINVLGQTETRVCAEHIMPHSKVTHNLFWTSVGPNMPGVFQLFGDFYGAGGAHGWDGTLCGSFTPGGETPLTFYQSEVQPLFNGVGTGTTACTSCHTGTPATAPAGLVLSAATSHANLVNVLSTELGTMDRVEPGNHLQSYLWHKIAGTHLGVGGSGGPPLSLTHRNTIQTWINNGANP